MAGVSLEQVETGLDELRQCALGKLELLSLQEVPRGEVGWGFHSLGKWHVYTFRDENEWRGSGIGFRSDAWTLMRKKSSSNGMWARLRRIEDGVEVWCGSSYLSQGATREKHGAEVHSFLEALPPTTLPVVFGSDVNTPIKWTAAEGLRALPTGPESKGEYMIALLHSKGLELTAPASFQWDTPTSCPRRADAAGRQIDVVGHKHTQAGPAYIVPGSHSFLGDGDHDAVCQVFAVSVRPSGRPRRPNLRPRVVTGIIQPPEVVNQKTLQHLARKHTKPVPGQAYEDPEDVKALFRMARFSKSSVDWKMALKARMKARKEWMNSKIQAANNGDWSAYQVVKKKGATGWEGHLANALGDDRDPHVEIHAHLQTVYGEGKTKVGPYPFSLDEVAEVPDFTLEELRDALRKGRREVSVGPDLVSHELLVSLAATPEGELRLLEWFNRLLHGTEPLPEDWSKATMVLIPKVTLPEDPKQVRPICVGLAASKLFCRMLLCRTTQALLYQGSAQSMGEGRQTCDYVFTVARLMQLEQEWRHGLCFLKLDVEKAFDSLDRKVFLHRLASKLGSTDVLRCWWTMFRETDAFLTTVWGESVINMITGIRQGSVESPQMFATVCQ